jgi:hypothetical protein
VLDDSAPRGEELPGGGDWNTARAHSSENARHADTLARGRGQQRGSRTLLRDPSGRMHSRIY